MRRLSAAALLAFVLAIGCGWNHAAAGPISLHNQLTRSFVDHVDGADPVNGNFWNRLDLFTNVSPFSLEVLQVDFLLFDPEDWGVPDLFGDAATGNARFLVADAHAALPEYFFGASWWETIDTPPVFWRFAETSNTFPIVLSPGESFVLDSIAHNSIFSPGDVAHGSDEIGELVIGFRLTGNLLQSPPPGPPAAVPEPSSLALFGIGALGAFVGARRRRVQVLETT